MFCASLPHTTLILPYTTQVLHYTTLNLHHTQDHTLVWASLVRTELVDAPHYTTHCICVSLPYTTPIQHYTTKITPHTIECTSLSIISMNRVSGCSTLHHTLFLYSYTTLIPYTTHCTTKTFTHLTPHTVERTSLSVVSDNRVSGSGAVEGEALHGGGGHWALPARRGHARSVRVCNTWPEPTTAIGQELKWLRSLRAQLICVWFACVCWRGGPGFWPQKTTVPIKVPGLWSRICCPLPTPSFSWGGLKDVWSMLWVLIWTCLVSSSKGR